MFRANNIWMVLLTFKLNVEVSGIAYVHLFGKLDVCMQVQVTVLMFLLSDYALLYVQLFA